MGTTVGIAVTSHPSGQEWGRVADDGTVFVRTADGERLVGQYPEGSPEEALKFYTDRYDALAFEVGLLEQRIKSGVMSPEEASESVKTVRGQVEGANAVGDLDTLLGEAGLVRRGHRRAARGPQGRARPEAGRGQGRQGTDRRGGREARLRHRLAQRRQPAARPARPVEGPPPHRPPLRRRAVAAVLVGADDVHQGAQVALRRAAREARGRARGQGAAGQGGRGPGRARPSGVRRRVSTAT